MLIYYARLLRRRVSLIKRIRDESWDRHTSKQARIATFERFLPRESVGVMYLSSMRYSSLKLKRSNGHEHLPAITINGENHTMLMVRGVIQRIMLDRKLHVLGKASLPSFDNTSKKQMISFMYINAKTLQIVRLVDLLAPKPRPPSYSRAFSDLFSVSGTASRSDHVCHISVEPSGHLKVRPGWLASLSSNFAVSRYCDRSESGLISVVKEYLNAVEISS